MKIKVTHIGEDYATIQVGEQEFETSLGLGIAIKKEQGAFSKKANDARSKKLSPERRKQISQKALLARWKKSQ